MTDAPSASVSPAASRADAVARGIEHAILEQRLPPGNKLGEDEVGAAFDVSRTIVRAALQKLAHARLVDLVPNRGATVARPSPRQAREVMEARALVEPPIARAAAGRMSACEAESLARHIDAEHAALADGEVGRSLHLSGQFHLEIARIADQHILAEVIDNLVARSSLIIALYWRRRSALCESTAHHALVGALSDRDGAAAERLMLRHLADLLDALDLTERTPPQVALHEALGQP